MEISKEGHLVQGCYASLALRRSCISTMPILCVVFESILEFLAYI